MINRMADIKGIILDDFYFPTLPLEAPWEMSFKGRIT